MHWYRVLIGVAAIVASSPNISHARWEGVPEGAVNVDVYIRPRPGDQSEQGLYTLVVSVANYYRQQSGEGTIHVSLPTGLSLVKGELEHQVRFGTPNRSDRYWTIEVEAQPGTYSIRSNVSVGIGSDWIEEGLYEAEVQLSPTRVGADNRCVWGEKKLNGQRFAYATKYLVLLEDDEESLSEPVKELPVPEHTTDGSCRGCTCDSISVVPMVFTVGRNGQLRWIRALRPVDARLEAAAARVLRTWAYRPARAGGKRVSYWATADVTVHCTP